MLYVTSARISQHLSRVARLSSRKTFRSSAAGVSAINGERLSGLITPKPKPEGTHGPTSILIGDVPTNFRWFSVQATPSTPAPASDCAVTALIREIKADLIEADVNNDGKIDAEELKIILRKAGKFSDREILELSDIFYTGRGGASIKHEDFLKGVASIISGKEEGEDDVEAANAASHRRTDQNKTHPLGLGSCSSEYLFGKERGLYTAEELDIKQTHMEPKTVSDYIALYAVRVIRFGFDIVSLWNFGDITKNKVYRRVIFLESVAAVPGFVAAMVRHFRSVRNFSRDGGMLQMFLDEANNERMHLLTFIRMRDPGKLMRACVLVSQTITGTGLFILYNISPDFCHRFVGYIEEEACHTYTTIIEKIENAPEESEMATWRTEKAPSIARAYWRLGEEGTVLDMIYAVRADEAEHRDVNHVCSGLKEGQQNPLYNPQEKFDQMLLKYVKDVMKREDVDSANPPASVQTASGK